MSTLLEPVCHICGIPTDAGFFDVSTIVDSPKPGEEVVLASYQLHPNYCGALVYFAQFTDVHAQYPVAAWTPGLEWEIRCNGNPRDPYLRFDRIINPWGLSGFPIHLRLEEGCLTELVVRRVVGAGSTPPVKAALLVRKPGRGSPSDSFTRFEFPVPSLVGGRLLGRFWYNPVYGGLGRSR